MQVSGVPPQTDQVPEDRGGWFFIKTVEGSETKKKSWSASEDHYSDWNLLLKEYQRINFNDGTKFCFLIGGSGPDAVFALDDG